ncbi:hypothetical protein ZHAS_00012567 [Anopheles sinensis]|uniref:Peptidase S1 domain-containing protein n=1 Tax=Anopheles sinensis TaxID=74873 RepID=A0A084W387_ANOSI|nr:hypothetical protein ZHAS_00012567 [Anopheles sinensis]
MPTVANIITHPEFSMSNVANDIAIVKLSSGINITYFVRPVCLWTLNDELHRIVGTNGTVIGFGFTEQDKTSDTLREATLTVVNVTTCLISDRQTYGSLLNHNMFCAGGKNNVSACNGDSGGGLFFNINGTWHLRGIVSFIPGRPDTVPKVCDSSKYTVFTDVSRFAAWILPYTTTAKWRKDLKPCQDSVDDKAIMCNAASRHDNNFLLIKTENGIGRVSLSDGQNFTIFDVSSTDGMIGYIGYDCATDRIYWTQNMDGNIYSMANDGADQRTFIKQATGEPFYLTLDWISRRLYWYDRKKKTIEVASLENPDLRAVLFTNLEPVWSIAIDPHDGKLYWTERNVKLEWSNLDGTERQILIERPRVKNIDGIKVSLATGELCYVDHATEQINCIDTRTKQIRTIVSHFTTGWTYFAVDDELLFWSERYSDIIERVDNYGVRRKPIDFPWSGEIEQMEAVTGMCPTVQSKICKHGRYW